MKLINKLSILGIDNAFLGLTPSNSEKLAVEQ